MLNDLQNEAGNHALPCLFKEGKGCLLNSTGTRYIRSWFVANTSTIIAPGMPYLPDPTTSLTSYTAMQVRYLCSVLPIIYRPLLQLSNNQFNKCLNDTTYKDILSNIKSYEAKRKDKKNKNGKGESNVSKVKKAVASLLSQIAEVTFELTRRNLVQPDMENLAKQLRMLMHFMK